ncbi:uncharacterized protein FA14DRAFT_22232 [Meira miltonrushii]|uniref:RRM domain-containing protein n=1 Tax=Meira miltonrushii TaxID=1280837 RepID=A0A316VK97_9BASI|nr:uncharacterized protein FA14DRAFT_22232 [Meira miltonrushii]PWN38029.1 hypothetical protein FA14DRAFT_22232 [Meira miltonrushii]
MLRSSTPDQMYSLVHDITASSEPVTEDASFFAIKESRRRMLSLGQMDKKHATPTAEPNLLIPASKAIPENSETNRSSFVVRLDNIPWKLTHHDVMSWLPKPVEKLLPSSDTVAQSVHIPIDVVSGKTSNCCFVECRDKEQAMRLVRHRNNARLLGRPVSLILTNHDDLLNEIFPFRLVSPRKDEEHCIYFTPGILMHLVQLLRSGSPQLKGPAKVVDLTTSMIRLVPARLNERLRTVLFGRVKEIICTCILAPRELVGIHESLNRLLLASSTCACFTVAQRIDILDSARQALNTIAPQH